MNWLDLVIVVLAVAYAAAGIRAGFVMNLIEGACLLLGGTMGVLLVPRFLGDREPSTGTAIAAVLVVLVLGAFGQVVGHLIGRSMRVKSGPWRGLDAIAGGVLGVLTVLVAVWAIGFAASTANLPWLSKAVSGSRVLVRVNGAMPQPATEAMNTFSRTLSQNVFPRYLDPFQQEVITGIEAPDAATLKQPGVVAARASVVKVVGAADCDRGIEGSGFVYSRGRVMTNAHVVAGVAEPQVIVAGRRWRAHTVVFDPKLDVAVLRVDGLPDAPISFDYDGKAGSPGAVLGYPHNGPFDARAARIRQELNLRSPDIHGIGKVTRETFSVRALVRSGNSGGPLVSAEGKVYGVVFAASLTSKDTGYALTANQVKADADKGRSATAHVNTGQCA